MLPILPDDTWKPPDSSQPQWRIVMLLAANVGLPYFLLAASAPLVQAWYSRAFHGRSPYRFYALSNVGSLSALLSYPFVIEPAFDIPHQSTLVVLLFRGLRRVEWRLGLGDGAVELASGARGVGRRERHGRQLRCPGRGCCCGCCCRRSGR